MEGNIRDIYKHTTFLGMEMAQTAEEFGAWEVVLKDINFNRIIELGTWKGALSTYLLLYCKNRDAEFYTYDIKPYENNKFRKEIGLDKCFNLGDLFEVSVDIENIIMQDGVTILFCDGGNKIKEFIEFSPFLKAGDIIVAHDWGTEIGAKHVDLTGLKKIHRTERLIFFEKV